MYSTLVTFALLATSAIQSVVAAGSLNINKPTLTQCKDVEISWSNTKGPYNVIVVDAAEPCGDILADLGDHTGTKLQWKVAIPAGKQVELSIEDANGNEDWSGVITVGASDDTSCLKASGSGVSGAQAANVGGTTTIPAGSNSVSPSSSSATPSNSAPKPVGGVGNAGNNPLGLNSGALTMRQASTPVMIFGALAAVLIASL